MQRTAHLRGWRRWEAALLGLTLFSSAVHFVDNALRLDLYPGPTWFTRDVVLTAWVIVLAAACLTYWVGTRKALVAYGFLGFAGFAHFFIRHQASLPLRCTITIGAEAGASALLIAYALLRRDSERS